MAIDTLIIGVSAFVFDTNTAMYAVITAIVAAKVIAIVMLGFSGKFIQFDIIPTSAENERIITEYILKDVNRAVTSHISRGEYTQQERRTLSVVCTPAESMKIKKFVAETDPQAFATIMPVTTVWGKRFSDITEVDNV
jgi:uncharacterized membrane-anchored protein YitT (DUF2179 family)